MEDNMNFPHKLPRLQVLDEAGIKKLYFTAVEVLERTGVSVPHKEASDLLRDAGAWVKDDVAHIPSSLVERAVQSAPKQIIIYTTDGRPAMRLTGRNVYFGTGENTIFKIDGPTGERKQWGKNDVIDAVVLQDQMAQLDFMTPLGLVQDRPAAVSHMHQFEIMVTYSTKPVMFSAYDDQGVRDIIDMAAVVNSPETIEQKPFWMNLMASTTPLIHTNDVLGKLLLSAEKRIPVIYSCAQVAGVTSPVTLAGTIVINLAEGLSALVIAQLKNAGAPMIMPGVIMNMDMKSSVTAYGSPESTLMACAIGEVYHWLGLTHFGTAGCSDAKIADEQAAMESCFSLMAQTSTGCNVIHDVGYLESGLAGSLELVVMTNELLGMVRRFQQGIHLGHASLAADLIDKVGIGNQYLTETHTYDHFRTENWQPDLMDRNRYDEWDESGRKDLAERAQERVKEILAGPRPAYLDKRQTEELSGIIKRRTQEIGVKG
jgi:trimethylamine--corrinoid protein Co-methyltransferase